MMLLSWQLEQLYTHALTHAHICTYLKSVL
jgi:hypothetical protein